MNNDRRNKIKEIIRLISIAEEKLDSVLNDEQYYYDNMPENLQGSMRGCRSEEIIDLLSECIDDINNINDNLEDCVS